MLRRLLLRLRLWLGLGHRKGRSHRNGNGQPHQVHLFHLIISSRYRPGLQIKTPRHTFG
jgi:hypothetical protein